MTATATVLRTVTYSNGDVQHIYAGAHPKLGTVHTYSDGASETTSPARPVR